jgi:cell division protein FtsI (penicillin-binding protein 3)/stage V sporulation protein D (sporulation-specific penicillin-binding protein)
MAARVANRRIRLLAALFALVFAIAVARAGWLQAIRANALTTMAVSQHRETVEVPAHRGTIYDRLGFELALGSPATTVYANPRQISDPRLVALAAGRTLGVDPDTLYPLLADQSRGFVYVQRQADPEKAQALQQQGIVGLGFYPEEKRIYPQGRVGASVVGYAGVDNKGLAGIELSLNRVLTGRTGEKTIVKDPFGRTLEVVGSKPRSDGRDVYLTVDHTLQGQVERILEETVTRWSAKSASAVVMDPRTGGILALAVAPGYDANRFSKVSDDRKRNRVVTDTYEPGSTFKIVTITGALETDQVTPDTKFTLPYQIQVADRKIHDAEPRGTETMSVHQILSRSSNVGVVTIAEALGKERIAHWIERFGFGRRTGIEFPGETKGIVVPPARWSGSTIGNVPIGQGIAATPLQMIAAYGAIANNGVWVQPHLVEKISGERALQPNRRRIMTRRTAVQVRKMLREVVEEGSGTAAQIPGYHIAGKTGTAAKPDGEGGYSDYRYVASFVGFVPAQHPRFVALVTVDEPRGAIWGSVVAAPAFAEIAKFALQYLEVPPD